MENVNANTAKKGKLLILLFLFLIGSLSVLAIDYRRDSFTFGGVAGAAAGYNGQCQIASNITISRSFNLTSLALNLTRVGAANRTFGIMFYNYSALSVYPSGRLGIAKERVNISGFPATPNYLEVKFNFSNPIKVEAGKQYAVVTNVSGGCPAGSQYVKILYSNRNNRTTVQTSDYSTWSAVDVGWDFYYKTYAFNNSIILYFRDERDGSFIRDTNFTVSVINGSKQVIKTSQSSYVNITLAKNHNYNLTITSYNYSTRHVILNVPSYSSYNATLYFAPSATTKDYAIYTKSLDFNSLTGSTVYVSKIVNATNATIDIQNTDATGSVLLNLISGDSYNIKAVKDGYTTQYRVYVPKAEINCGQTGCLTVYMPVEGKIVINDAYGVTVTHNLPSSLEQREAFNLTVNVVSQYPLRWYGYKLYLNGTNISQANLTGGYGSVITKRLNLTNKTGVPISLHIFYLRQNSFLVSFVVNAWLSIFQPSQQSKAVNQTSVKHLAEAAKQNSNVGTLILVSTLLTIIILIFASLEFGASGQLLAIMALASVIFFTAIGWIPLIMAVLSGGVIGVGWYVTSKNTEGY